MCLGGRCGIVATVVKPSCETRFNRVRAGQPPLPGARAHARPFGSFPGAPSRAPRMPSFDVPGSPVWLAAPRRMRFQAPRVARGQEHNKYCCTICLPHEPPHPSPLLIQEHPHRRAVDRGVPKPLHRESPHRHVLHLGPQQYVRYQKVARLQERRREQRWHHEHREKQVLQERLVVTCAKTSVSRGYRSGSIES